MGDVLGLAERCTGTPRMIAWVRGELCGFADLNSSVSIGPGRWRLR